MILTLIIIYLAFAIQLGLVPHFGIIGSTPNILVIVLVAMMFSGRKNQAQLVVGLGGLLLDLFSPFRFGVYILLYLAVFWLLGHFLRRFLSGGSLLAWLGIMAFAASIIQIPALIETLSIQIFIGNIAYTVILSLLGYLIINLLGRSSNEMEV